MVCREMMNNIILSEIAKKIIKNILQVKPGQTVTIFAEIHNISDPSDPLEEIYIVEEFAIQLRKHRALAVLDISTENLHRRVVTEIFEDNNQTLPELFNIWQKTSDYFIDISWRSSPSFYKSIPEGHFQKISDLSDFYIRQMEKNNKRIILLGAPTKCLSKYYNIDHDVLIEAYLSALNTDYFSLKQNCLIFKGKIIENEGWQITTENRTLNLDLIGHSKCYYGEFSNYPILSLPTGYWEQEINLSSINGIFYCDYVYYDDNIWRNVQLIFEKGNIVDIETDIKQKNIYFLKSIIHSDFKTAILKFGLNNSIQKMSLYSLFDVIKFPNLSICMTSHKGEFIFLSEKSEFVTQKNS